MDSYESILATTISVLQQKASARREAEKKDVIVELRKLIGHYDIQASELFSDAKSPAIAKPASGRSKAVLPPKYRDPVTGKTWSGHGKRPLWLVGDKEKYLIAASSSEARADLAKPKKSAPGGGDWKSRLAKLTETKAPKKAAKYTGKKRGRKPKKTASGADLAEAAESGATDFSVTE
ncbi:MAG: H-NS histone family protein [Candidatus Accumulibacter sp.]|jgi:DNA-binding protein H-NS|nr:H-NS histone family protein [Accumulibacter sp.]